MGKYTATKKIINKDNKKVKEPKFRSENESEIRQFIVILIVVLIIVLGVYLLSKLIVNKRDNNTNITTVVGSIDYNKVSVGTILNRPYDEYYVMLYDGEDTNAPLYSSIVTTHLMKSDVKIYYCDLGNELNSKYKSNVDTGNKDAKSINEMSFGKVTLLKIQNGKISLYLEDIEKIKTELSK